MPNIANLLRNFIHKKRVERDLDDEIHFYLETLTQQGVAAGLSEQEARRVARLELGSVGSVKDAVRDVRTGAMMERIWQDCRYAIRALRKTPGFTAAAVFVLALGIGANSAVFSLINALLLQPLAVTKPERLTGLYSRDTKHPDSYRAFSYPNYVDIRDNNPAFSSLMAHQLALVGVKDGDNTRRDFADIVSSNYFQRWEFRSSRDGLLALMMKNPAESYQPSLRTHSGGELARIHRSSAENCALTTISSQ